jgi:transcriptional regulator with XRE-family HTH domain
MSFRRETWATIKREMVARKMQQRQLARALGVSESYISQIFSIEANITLDKTDRILKAIRGS